MAEPKNYPYEEVPNGTRMQTCPRCQREQVPELPGAVEWHWINVCSAVRELRFDPETGALVGVAFHP